MLENISIGRYYKADSLLHRTDPRVKTILYILYLAAIFIISTPQAIIALTVITLIQLIMGKIKPGILWTTVKPILPLAIFILLLNVLKKHSLPLSAGTPSAWLDRSYWQSAPNHVPSAAALYLSPPDNA